MVTIATQVVPIEAASRVRAERTDQSGGFITKSDVQGALEDLDAAAQSLAGELRIVTDAGTVTVSSTEGGVAVNKTVGAATTVQLPTATSRNGIPVIVKDMKKDANTNNITVLPAGAETIDGNAQDIININAGSRGYRPISGGWLRT